MYFDMKDMNTPCTNPDKDPGHIIHLTSLTFARLRVTDGAAWLIWEVSPHTVFQPLASLVEGLAVHVTTISSRPGVGVWKKFQLTPPSLSCIQTCPPAYPPTAHSHSLVHKHITNSWGILFPLLEYWMFRPVFYLNEPHQTWQLLNFTSQPVKI